MFPSPQSSQTKTLCAHQHNLKNIISPSWDCLRPSSQRMPVSHISLPQDLFPSIVHMCAKGALLRSSTFPEYPEARQLPLPTGIVLWPMAFLPTLGGLRLLSSFSILVNGRPLPLPSCICSQPFCSASHRPRLLEASLLSARVTTRSSSAPGMCLLCRLTL